MAKNHFSVVQNGSQSAPQNANLGDFGYFGGTENGTWGARIKILRLLFNTNTPIKPPFRNFGNHFGPRKSEFWPFYFFSHFPIEIPIGPAGGAGGLVELIFS